MVVRDLYSGNVAEVIRISPRHAIVKVPKEEVERSITFQSFKRNWQILESSQEEYEKLQSILDFTDGIKITKEGTIVQYGTEFTKFKRVYNNGENWIKDYLINYAEQCNITVTTDKRRVNFHKFKIKNRILFACSYNDRNLFIYAPRFILEKVNYEPIKTSYIGALDGKAQFLVTYCTDRQLKQIEQIVDLCKEYRLKTKRGKE